MKRVLDMDGGDVMHNVNVLNATELYTLKWLIWYMLCFMFFTTIKKKWKRTIPGWLYDNYHKFSWKIQSLTKCQVCIGGQKYSFFKDIAKFTFITKNKRVNIFNDSCHVFGVVNDFELIQKQSYFLTSSSTAVKTVDNKYINYLMS